MLSPTGITGRENERASNKQHLSYPGYKSKCLRFGCWPWTVGQSFALVVQLLVLNARGHEFESCCRRIFFSILSQSSQKATAATGAQ